MHTIDPALGRLLSSQEELNTDPDTMPARMNLLLVLGAGASRNLGKDGQPMPLMSDWSNALCEELDRRDGGLAAACHLEPGMDGPTFETNLGLLLEWQSARWLEKRFQGLGGEKPGQAWPQVGKARKLIDRRMEIIMDVIHTTLYDQFGQKRIDDDLAEGAYQALLSECKGTVDHLLIATTNYDRAAESALRNIGWSVTTGFRAAAI